MSPVSTILTALNGIAGNKLRAALTTLGIIIGVASVIAMLALGHGARVAVEANFRFLGADQVQISPYVPTINGREDKNAKILSFEDGLLLPEAVELVRRVDMAVSSSTKVRNGRYVLDMGVSGTTADALVAMASKGQVQPVGWPEGVPLSEQAYVEHGRFFSPAEVLEASGVCVLGYQTALDLFQGDDPVGQTVWVGRNRYLVIGVLGELEMVDPEQRSRSKPNDALYLPISTAIRDLYEEEPSVMMTAYVTDETRIGEAKVQIAQYLRERHQVEKDEEGEYEDDFHLTTRQDILGAQQEAARTFSVLLAAMAAVSLVVGGIGIMNVMLVSVSERTREIGVRLAVGARPRDIVAQFLLEAMVIGVVGGVIGVAVGILSVPLAASLNEGIAVLAPESIPLALGVAMGCGLVFGLYPAVRAAQLDPIEALRYE